MLSGHTLVKAEDPGFEHEKGSRPAQAARTPTKLGHLVVTPQLTRKVNLLRTYH
jgi:hypothetical protein